MSVKKYERAEAFSIRVPPDGRLGSLIIWLRVRAAAEQKLCIYKKDSHKN